MRTTVTIDDQLLKEAKRTALEEGSTLKRLIEESLRESLARRAAGQPSRKVVLRTVKGKLRPGVNLDDSGALLDLMEGLSASP